MNSSPPVHLVKGSDDVLRGEAVSRLIDQLVDGRVIGACSSTSSPGPTSSLVRPSTQPRLLRFSPRTASSWSDTSAGSRRPTSWRP